MRAGRIRAASLAALLALAALTGCVGEPDHDGEVFEIAGGGATGIYYGYGEQLAAVLARDLGLHIEVAETDGSVDNLRRVGADDALLGFAQSDAAADAVAGTGAFTEPLPITAVARLYDEYVHLVVRADSDLEGIADLRDRAVSLGADDSGVNVIATRVLEAAGVDPSQVRNSPLGLAASIDALQRGEIEAFFWVGGLPTPGIEQLAQTTATRLLPIDAAIVESVNDRSAGVYGLAELPAGIYGRDDPTPTMTVPNYLVASATAPPDLIRDALAVLFAARAEIAEQVPAAALLDGRQAIFTAPIDLHPGAIEYYRDARG